MGGVWIVLGFFVLVAYLATLYVNRNKKTELENFDFEARQKGSERK